MGSPWGTHQRTLSDAHCNLPGVYFIKPYSLISRRRHQEEAGKDLDLDYNSKTAWTPLDIYIFSTINFPNSIHPPCNMCFRKHQRKSHIPKIRELACSSASFLLIHFTSTHNSVFEVLVYLDLRHAQSSKETLKNLTGFFCGREGKSRVSSRVLQGERRMEERGLEDPGVMLLSPD